MIINAANIELAFKGFKSIYTDAYTAAPVDYDKIAMTIPSGAREENYGWLGQFPKMREWLTGEREIKQLEAFGFTIVNRKFESTVSVSRDDFSDDRLGVFKPMFAEMGQTARQHPDELVFSLLASGFTELCYDGQYFFDTDHPSTAADDSSVTVSNFEVGTDPAWYLLDTSRAVRPIIWQEREKYDFQHVNRADDEHVFMTDNYIYGIRARVNAGFGLWQLAYGSKKPLDRTTYAAARAAMMGLRGDKGRILGVRPTVLVVPPILEDTARQLLKAATNDASSNPWVNSAELVVTPYVEV